MREIVEYIALIVFYWAGTLIERNYNKKQQEKRDNQISDLLKTAFKKGKDQCDGAWCTGCWKDVVNEAIKKLSGNTEGKVNGDRSE